MLGHKIVIIPKQPTMIQLLEHQLLEAERAELDIESELEQAEVVLATLKSRRSQAGQRIMRLQSRLRTTREEVKAAAEKAADKWREDHP